MEIAMKRPSRFSLACLILGTFCSLNDLYEAISQAVVTIPIYHTGILTVVWSDYVLYTMPVSIAWLAISWATWAKGVDTT